MTTEQNKQLHIGIIKSMLPVIQQLNEKHDPFPKIDLTQKPIDEIKFQQQMNIYRKITNNVEKNSTKLSDELKLLLFMPIVMTDTTKFGNNNKK